MKKMFFALAALMVALPMVAQDYKIIHDETDSDGHRVILCEKINTRTFTDKQVFNIGMSAIVYTHADGRTDTTKYVGIQVNSLIDYKVEKGMLLLIKTVDDDVIELYSTDACHAKLLDMIWTGSNHIKNYGASVNYKITESDLAKLKKGIVKIRQEIVAGKHEKEYKKEKHIQKVTDAIINHDKLINEALATEKAFDSDF